MEKKESSLWERIRKKIRTDRDLKKKENFALNIFSAQKIIQSGSVYLDYYQLGDTSPFLHLFVKDTFLPTFGIESANSTEQNADVTGVIKIWPCEEMLAHYCISHPEQFVGKTVCELGGGFASFAALALSILFSVIFMSIEKLCKNVLSVVVTDGNAESVKKLSKNIALNFKSSEDVKAEKLLWEVTYKSSVKYDVILVADCLYCIPFHDALIHTFTELMHDKSVCIILAPKRGYSLDRFIEKLKVTPGLQFMVSESITEMVDKRMEELKKLKSYSESEHKPYLVLINRS